MTNSLADADTLIRDAQRIQNARACTLADALLEACGNPETVKWVMLVLLGDVDGSLDLSA